MSTTKRVITIAGDTLLNRFREREKQFNELRQAEIRTQVQHLFNAAVNAIDASFQRPVKDFHEPIRLFGISIDIPEAPSIAQRVRDMISDHYGVDLSNAILNGATVNRIEEYKISPRTLHERLISAPKISQGVGHPPHLD